jgi:probable rRNA maturation factor
MPVPPPRSDSVAAPTVPPSFRAGKNTAAAPAGKARAAAPSLRRPSLTVAHSTARSAPAAIRKKRPPLAMPSRPLAIANRHPRLRLDRRALARVIAALDARAADFRGGCPPGELSLVFLTDAAQARLHADFLNDPTPTDVITFEGDPALAVAGEICVSADTAAAYAKKHRRELSPELTLYVVHGWLHLAGYDDLQPTKKRIMRRAEARAMGILADADALPSFRLAPSRKRR